MKKVLSKTVSLFGAVAIAGTLLLGACSAKTADAPASVSGVVTEKTVEYSKVDASSPKDVVTAYFRNWFTPSDQSYINKVSEAFSSVNKKSEETDLMKRLDAMAADNEASLKGLREADRLNGFYDYSDVTPGGEIIIHTLNASFEMMFSSKGVKEVKVDDSKFTKNDDGTYTVPTSAITLIGKDGKETPVDKSELELKLVKKDGKWLVSAKPLVDKTLKSIKDAEAGAQSGSPSEKPAG